MELPTVSLTRAQMHTLRAFTSTGTHKAREITRANILMLAHECRREDVIAAQVRHHVRTVRRVIARFKEGGIDRALFDAPRSGQPRKTNDLDDAHLVAIACTDAPSGSAHWTLDLLVKRFAKDRRKKLGRSAIYLRLSQRGIKPWREKNVVYPEDYAGVHRADGRCAVSLRDAIRSETTRALHG